MCSELNNKVLKVYLDNRGAKFVKLAEEFSVPKGLLSNLKLIEKLSEDCAFSILVNCVENGKGVHLSNGTVSSNFCHIKNSVKLGSCIVECGSAPKGKTPRSDSCLYLLKAGDYHKIGVTLDSSAKNRVKQIQTGNPHKIEVVAVSKRRGDAYEIEQKLFSMFANSRMSGEWFELNRYQIMRTLSLFN